MATPNPSFNPMTVTTGEGLFQLSSEGLVQGFQMPDAATRNSLSQGIVSSSETEVMYGGIAIKEFIASSDSMILGPVVARAATTATITGFTVTNQAYNGITTTSSAPQQYGSNMSVQFQQLGTGARVVVAIEPTFAASIANGTTSINAPCSWDFDNQWLTANEPTHGNLAISAMTWAAGVVSVTVASNALITGDLVTISGATPSGYNGDFIITVVDATHFTFELASNPGAYVSGAQVDAATTDPLDVKVLRVNIGNSQTITVDGDDLVWNPNGSAAVIQL